MKIEVQVVNIANEQCATAHKVYRLFQPCSMVGCGVLLCETISCLFSDFGRVSARNGASAAKSCASDYTVVRAKNVNVRAARNGSSGTRCVCETFVGLAALAL